MLALAPRLGPFSPPPTPSCAQVLAELARTQRPALAPQRQRLCAALAADGAQLAEYAAQALDALAGASAAEDSPPPPGPSTTAAPALGLRG
jgi:hypothetical protein